MSTFSQFFPPKPTFSVRDIPDLTGKVMIVTGGYTGIGKETVKALLPRNAKVYIAGRSLKKAEEAMKDLRQQTGKDAHFIELDLASLASVRRAAKSFLQKESKLHVLFNNGGVMQPPIDQLTSDGYDLQFGTNVLGHFYFTRLLLPTLMATSTPASPARVVNTSSYGHQVQNELVFESFRDGDVRRKIGRAGLYYQSKLGNVVFATELARRYGDKGIVSTSLNPGNLHSELQRTLDLGTLILSKIISYPTPLGALTQLYAGTMPEGAKFNGKYLIPWARLGTATPESQDPKLGKKLWEYMEGEVARFESQNRD
ncbi:NAD-P-binding protein [Stereum hirsutum FP-91666 SS1]|uniref:NAD-P-binding protein n=1 Tax=Stereum hirsutum (strain FP-91666) TaxID=721885 RepID=UPI0004449920|nr:NAD-P-binding protein [Stereum hirsutum FP-91666 SS1]EIM82656.1 NAD-P-binding protein [Stereum hirsutum FP-91666 SS1]